MAKSIELTPSEISYLKSKKIGIVLSGGASRGFAEVGAMAVFEKYSIVPSAVVGCSVGSLIGTCVAAGKTVSLLESEFIEHKPFTWRDISLFFHSGLLNSEHIVSKILNVLEVDSFSQLKIPLFINATNIGTGKEKVFSKGKLLPALCASIAFPGVIAPRKIGKHYFVDGGVTTPIPVHLLPKNIELIVIIDVTGKVQPVVDTTSTLTLLRNCYEVMLHHLSNKDIREIKRLKNVILIQPPVDTFSLFNFDAKNMNSMSRLGEMTALTALKEGIQHLKTREKKLSKQ